MTPPNRRSFLLAAAVILPALVARGANAQQVLGLAGADNGRNTISPPLQPMIYTRRLVRNLSGGAQIVVERRFEISFTRSDSGFVVAGEQVSVQVETPEQLAWLGKLERERVEYGIFPLQLDASGRILSGEYVWGSPETETALRDIEQRVKQMDSTSGEDRAALQEFITAVHEAGAHILSTLPTDLFAPAEPDRQESREILLPYGTEGAVSTRFSAERDPRTGLMRSARREVVTAIEGDKRETIETFTLSAEAAASS